MAKRVAPMDPFEGPNYNNIQDSEPIKRTKVENNTPDIQTLNVKSPPPPLSSQPLVQESQRREARKAEIIRRCAELDPPLSLLELEHIPSFNASIKIAKDFTDQDWDFLKPRLLAELPTIQSTIKENEALIASIRTGQAEGVSSPDQEHFASNSPLPRQGESPVHSKQARDPTWTENQKPTRDLLENIVRSYIRTTWDDGRAINYYNAPRFAAQALVHARDQFVRQRSDIISNCGKLVLDDMKWLYDTVLKPYTEAYRKDIFNCRVCEFSSKPLEACIQHFAHKHTNSFSVGSSGVAWCEAEWPKDPPFNPNPPPFLISTPAAQFPHMGTPTQHNPSYYPPPQSTPTPGNYYQHGYGPNSISPPPPYTIPPAQPGMPSYPHYAGGSPVPMHPFPPQHGSPMQQHGWTVPPPRFPSLSPAPTILPGGQQLPPYNSHNAQAPPQFRDSAIDELGRFMSQAWLLLSKLGAIGLDDSIVVYAVLYHGMSEFFKHYRDFPSLDTLMASLDRHAHLISFKRKDKLACKACTKTSDIGSDEPQISRKLYNITSLLQHFKNVHQPAPKKLNAGVGAENKNDLIALDWKVDMIELPDSSQIARFAGERDLGQPQLGLFLDAFPDALSDDLQRRSQSGTLEYDPRNPNIVKVSNPLQKQAGSAEIGSNAYRHAVAAADQFLNELGTSQGLDKNFRRRR